MKRFSSYHQGVIAIITLSFVLACMGLFARYLGNDLQLFQQVYLRIGAAFLLASLFFYKDLRLEKIKKLPRKELSLIAFRGISFYLGGVVLFTQAILLTKYSNVAFVAAIPMTAILGVLLLKEKINLLKVLLIFLGFAGVVLVAVTDYSNLFSWGLGEICMMLATIFFSLSYIGRKWQSNILNNKELTILMFCFGGVAVFIASLFMGEGIPSIAAWNPAIILVLLGAGLFNVFNVFLVNYGFQRIEAVLANNLLMIEILFALILGLTFYREIPTIKELLGGMLIVISAIGMNELEKKK